MIYINFGVLYHEGSKFIKQSVVTGIPFLPFNNPNYCFKSCHSESPCMGKLQESFSIKLIDILTFYKREVHERALSAASCPAKSPQEILGIKSVLEIMEFYSHNIKCDESLLIQHRDFVFLQICWLERDTFVSSKNYLQQDTECIPSVFFSIISDHKYRQILCCHENQATNTTACS